MVLTPVKEKAELVRFSVVGCGNIGGRHLAVLDSLEGASIASFCDIDPAKREKCGALFPGVPAYASIDEMLQRTDAQVVNVCTPHYLHAGHALKVIAAGRHVLVEKPMALTVADADRMIAAAEKAEVLLMVVMQNRYNVPVVLTRKAIAEGRLGRILMAQCNVVWNRCPEYYSQSPWLGRKAFEGGALYTQVSHFIDLILWLCGDVIDASAHIETKNHDVEIEDCGVALLRLLGGTMSSLFWTTCAYDRNFEGSILLVGERGTVKIGGQYLNRMEHWEVEGYPLPEGINWADRPNSYGKYQGSSSNHDKVLADVIRAVNNQGVELVTGEEGRKTVRAIELIYERCNGGDGGGRKG
jgi:predicted dehydrogenase